MHLSLVHAVGQQNYLAHKYLSYAFTGEIVQICKNLLSQGYCSLQSKKFWIWKQFQVLQYVKAAEYIQHKVKYWQNVTSMYLHLH